VVENYGAHVDAAINHNVYAPQYAWDLNDDDPVYSFTSNLRISGISVCPQDRRQEHYELTIYGDDAPSRKLAAKLRDVQVRDKYGSPLYRTYRGREIPVYDPPKGMGILEKVRGENRWTAWLNATPSFVSDARALLAVSKGLFMVIDEHRSQRTRWVRRVTLQTSNLQEE
jgi:hypothetical protein